MFDLLFDFFMTKIFYYETGIIDNLSDFFNFENSTGNIIDWQEYLSFICSVISIIVILILCCLFIGKIIKTIGRLFSGGTL